MLAAWASPCGHVLVTPGVASAQLGLRINSATVQWTHNQELHLSIGHACAAFSDAVRRPLVRLVGWA
ncbi:hypothetical protein DENIT_30157 [Pseudomonas veronii]|nr:hypothetical protein DENIT_30157 [Pseudomonas veronii]